MTFGNCFKFISLVFYCKFKQILNLKKKKL